MTTRKEEKERLRQERLAAQAAAASEERKRMILGYLVAALLAGAVVAGIIFAVSSGGGGADSTQPELPEEVDFDIEDHPEFRTDIGTYPDGVEPDLREGTTPPAISVGDLAASAGEADCELQTDLDESGNTHYADEDKEGDNWETNPPTSGDHYGVPTETGSGALADGAYLSPPPMSRALHALEHGRVALQYDPGMPEEEQLALKGIFDADPSGVILFPNPGLDGELAVAAWTNLLTCEDFDGETGTDAVRNFVLQFRGRGPEPFPI